ncbi:MAG TPA: hypothetical protein VM686_15395, partial [Polyangiaceae bacterium]|nr:hypothetical protein [Polyangiaceae bacterium]
MQNTLQGSIVGPDAARAGLLQVAPRWLRQNIGKALKASFGCGVVALGLVTLVKPLLVPESLRAVVGRTATTVRAPIAGVLQGPHLALGELLPAGAPLGVLSNPWADVTQVRELETRVQSNEAELASLLPLSRNLRDFAAGLCEDAGRYQTRRKAQLSALAVQAAARLEADRARQTEAEERLKRSRTLVAQGLGTQQD